MIDKAIVTLVIGEPYLSTWRQVCSAHWQAYANRHGLDLIVITEPLLRCDRPHSWQKCFVLSQQFASHYSQIAMIDADVAINPEAPSVFEQVPKDRIGGVLNASHIHKDLKPLLLQRLTNLSVPYEMGGGQNMDRCLQSFL